MSNNKAETVSAKPPERILVTGAAGCVGHIMAEELYKKGYNLVLCDLPGAQMSVPEGERVKHFFGNIADPQFIEKIMKGVDHIINLAAIVDISRTYDELVGVNFHAVKSIYHTAKQAGVKRLIHYSTGSMYKEHYGPIHEEYPVDPTNGYARTKYMADDFLLSQPDDGPQITLIRPALIFGPRGKVLAATLATIPPIIKMVSGYGIRINGGPRSNWVHALDMVLGTIHLLENQIKNKEIVNIANEEYTPAGEAFNIAQEVCGLKLEGPAIPFSPDVFAMFMPIIGINANFLVINKTLNFLWDQIVKKNDLKHELRPQVDKEALIFTIRDTMFDVSKIKNYGYKLKYPDFRSGWVATVDWYKANKWLP